MAYYLTIKKNNKIIPIDISRLSEFSKKSNYVNGGFSLEEIDSCTMMFNNEYFFKEEDRLFGRFTLLRRGKKNYCLICWK